MPRAGSRRRWTGRRTRSPTSTCWSRCTVLRAASGSVWTRPPCWAAPERPSGPPSCSTPRGRSAGRHSRSSSSLADPPAGLASLHRTEQGGHFDDGPTDGSDMGGLTELRDWLSGRGLEVVLIIIGSVLLARFVSWTGGRITTRIDARSTGGDALVRSEAAKHRHSLTQVLTWAAVVLIYSIAVFFVRVLPGVPVTGLVAPATVLGVGLGFGAQRIVGDVLAGFFIITERQYGFGDVVAITVTGAAEPATGTVEDVTLRITRVRSPNGEVMIVPNGQIVKVVNLSRDWARAVLDVPVPTTVDINQVSEVLRGGGGDAFRAPDMRPLLLDPPSVMGVESLGLDEVNIRMVARTLPGKQFDVGRVLRARVVAALREHGMSLPASAPDGAGPGPDGGIAGRAGVLTREGERCPIPATSRPVNCRRSPPASARRHRSRAGTGPPSLRTWAGRARRPSSSPCSSSPSGPST